MSKYRLALHLTFKPLVKNHQEFNQLVTYSKKIIDNYQILLASVLTLSRIQHGISIFFLKIIPYLTFLHSVKNSCNINSKTVSQFPIKNSHGYCTIELFLK